MVITGRFRITSVKRNKEEDTEEPRTLSELEVHVISEWYDKKDKDLIDRPTSPSATSLP